MRINNSETAYNINSTTQKKDYNTTQNSNISKDETSKNSSYDSVSFSSEGKRLSELMSQPKSLGTESPNIPMSEASITESTESKHNVSPILSNYNYKMEASNKTKSKEELDLIQSLVYALEADDTIDSSNFYNAVTDYINQFNK